MTTPGGALPNRLVARRTAPVAVGAEPVTDPWRPVRTELAALRHRVVGVTGCIIAGVDGLLILHDSRSSGEPHDIAAMAAAAHGISRTCGGALSQGPFQEVTIRNRDGCLAVYGIGDLGLLAVVGDGTVNIARLHLESRAILGRLAALLGTESVNRSAR